MPMWTWTGETARRLRDAGQQELAEAVSDLPVLSESGDSVRVEATARSALRVARRLVTEAGTGEPEVPGLFGPPMLFFLAHWPMAVRVGALAEGERALKQAEAAAADEPGPETRGPLPVSALANAVRCHANVDARGTTGLRRELLSGRRLAGWERTPAWPGFVLARVDLLIDEGAPDRAETELRRFEHTATGTAVLDTGGVFTLARALRHQDRHREALATLDRLGTELSARRVGPREPALRRRVRFERARLLSWLARLGVCSPNEAIEALPTVEDAEAVPSLRPAWVETAENLVSLGAVRNDWRLGVRVTTWSRYFERVGAPGRGAELALAAARLAVARGARWVAACSARRAEELITHLGRTAEIRGDLGEVRSMITAMRPVEPEAPADRILTHLRSLPHDRVDPEHQAEQVNVALASMPHDTPLLTALGQVGRTLMLSDVATEPQWRHVRETPGDQKAALSLLETLLHDNDTAGVRTLVRTLAAGALNDVPADDPLAPAAPAVTAPTSASAAGQTAGTGHRAEAQPQRAL
ncbi:hypothetical protein [Nocardiopsis kunsanensis]|uniref:hypothetical protein n=1 Tax=Nocardiopsis kunsanensis TaxID=141693 RepID=UPI000348016E|nr:hypothetical protein [Nocardiopsis kunsanensis]